MSIAEEGKNINTCEAEGYVRRYNPYLVFCSLVLGIGSSIGLGMLWGRVNKPAPIIIECSDEVLKGLQATSSLPIKEIKTPKSPKKASFDLKKPQKSK